MNKGLITSAFVFVLLAVIYVGSYLSLREVKTFERQGYWIIYLYGDSFVRQYAIDDQAKLLFKRAIDSGDKSFFAGKEGDTGQDWFCVYRKPDTRYYRLFRTIEEIENFIRTTSPNDESGPDRKARPNSL